MVVAALLATPVAGRAQGLVGGAERGADEGSAAAGPVGAVVGGAVGAATGVANGALGVAGDILGVPDRPRFRTYVESEHVRSYDYDQPLRRGVILPEDYAFYDVPEDYHVHGRYRYTVINHRPVLVDPVTRRVVEVIE
jgi:hypothetical protein